MPSDTPPIRYPIVGRAGKDALMLGRHNPAVGEMGEPKDGGKKEFMNSGTNRLRASSHHPVRRNALLPGSSVSESMTI
jgi:hypothetical protein